MIYLPVCHFKTAVAYAKVIDRHPKGRANMIGLLNAQLTQVSNVLSTLITRAGLPTKRKTETERHTGLVDWVRQNPLTPESSHTPIASMSTSVETDILLTPWISSRTSWGKRKALEELSDSQTNSKRPRIQVARTPTPNPPSTDTENELQDAQPNPYPTGRGGPYIAETPELRRAESDYGEPDAADLNAMLAMGEAAPWDGEFDCADNEAMLLLVEAAERDLGTPLSQDTPLTMGLDEPITPARASPEGDAMSNALRGRNPAHILPHPAQKSPELTTLVRDRNTQSKILGHRGRKIRLGLTRF